MAVFIYLKRGDTLSKTWRLLLFSGLISVFAGIIYITSLLGSKSEGLDVWGFFLLFWGIVAIMSALNRFSIQWINKGLAVLGILLHGTLFFYWILFPDGTETKGAGGTVAFYAAASFTAAFCCIVILGNKVKHTASKSISK